jgi:hypothetical protein
MNMPEIPLLVSNALLRYIGDRVNLAGGRVYRRRPSTDGVRGLVDEVRGVAEFLKLDMDTPLGAELGRPGRAAHIY